MCKPLKARGNRWLLNWILKNGLSFLLCRISHSRKFNPNFFLWQRTPGIVFRERTVSPSIESVPKVGCMRMKNSLFFFLFDLRSWEILLWRCFFCRLMKEPLPLPTLPYGYGGSPQASMTMSQALASTLQQYSQVRDAECLVNVKWFKTNLKLVALYLNEQKVYLRRTYKSLISLFTRPISCTHPTRLAIRRSPLRTPCNTWESLVFLLW